MIQVQNLTKRYGPTVAVKDLSFTVATGEILGFLGPNGAGKTTTMKILTCFMSPTEGQVSLEGLDVLEQEPPSVDNALINAKLTNLIITPHVAWASQQSRQRLVDELVKNINAYSENKPRNIITHP